MKWPAWPSPSPAAILHFNSSRTTVRTKQPKKPPPSILVKAQQFSSNYLCHSGWKKKKKAFFKKCRRREESCQQSGHPIGTSIPSGSGGLNPRIYLAHVSGHTGITVERPRLKEVRLGEDEQEQRDAGSAGCVCSPHPPSMIRLWPGTRFSHRAAIA